MLLGERCWPREMPTNQIGLQQFVTDIFQNDVYMIEWVAFNCHNCTNMTNPSRHASRITEALEGK